jgi:tellurite resistance protein TerC
VGLWAWALLAATIAAFLLVDFLVAGRRRGIPPIRESAAWSVAWTLVALGFAGVLAFWRGVEPAEEYLAGYLIERSLSLDNLFIFALIFTYFAVPEEAQRRVLLLGIAGAIVLRAAFIFGGGALLQAFHPTMYVFGAVLVLTGIRMATHRTTEIHPERNPVLRLVRRVVPTTSEYHGDRVFAPKDGRRVATPLLPALVVIATFDVVFAIDSIPAIFAITRDTFIVFAANAFSLLGLTSLYFVLAGMVNRFAYLNLGLAAVLVFVGLKMLVSDFYDVPTALSLGFIVLVLGAAILGSYLRDRRERQDSRRVRPASAR